MAGDRTVAGGVAVERLAFVPGVTMMFDGGASGVPMITSRGFFGGGEVEYVKLIVDGVPVGDAESGTSMAELSCRGDRADRVLHGRARRFTANRSRRRWCSSSRGSKPGSGSSGELHLSGGSFDTRNADLGYLTDLGDLRLDVRADTADTGGFRAHAGNSNRGLQLALLRFGERARWRFEAAGDHKDRREPGPLTFTEIGIDREQSNALFASTRATDRYRLAPRTTHSAPAPRM